MISSQSLPNVLLTEALLLFRCYETLINDTANNECSMITSVLIMLPTEL